MQFISETPDMNSSDVMAYVSTIESDVASYASNLTEINTLIDAIASASGLESVKNNL